jgi:hypothetical protein
MIKLGVVVVVVVRGWCVCLGGWEEMSAVCFNLRDTVL